ncbi:MAG: segregation and condensation protein A [Eggerthellaceae bacterium]|jgi:segregation and condensation protein A
MAYRVHTEEFEGPFDLLLYLVSRQRIDIGSISIAEITDQYLAEISHMRKLDLDVASDFLVVASTLLEIKAASLIPDGSSEAEEQGIDELGPNEAREILLKRLLTYKQFKNAAAGLETRGEAAARCHARTFGAPREFLNLYPDYLEGVSLDSLAYLCVNALTTREESLLERDHVAEKHISVETTLRGLYARLKNERHLQFSQLVNDTTPLPVAVVTFLSLLELYKRNHLILSQDHPFGDIDIDFKEEGGDLVLDEDHALTSVID